MADIDPFSRIKPTDPTLGPTTIATRDALNKSILQRIADQGALKRQVQSGKDAYRTAGLPLGLNTDGPNFLGNLDTQRRSINEGRDATADANRTNAALTAGRLGFRAPLGKNPTRASVTARNAPVEVITPLDVEAAAATVAKGQETEGVTDKSIFIQSNGMVGTRTRNSNKVLTIKFNDPRLVTHARERLMEAFGNSIDPSSVTVDNTGVTRVKMRDGKNKRISKENMFGN
jgi:hypothetical protein